MQAAAIPDGQLIAGQAVSPGFVGCSGCVSLTSRRDLSLGMFGKGLLDVQDLLPRIALVLRIF